MKEILIKNVQDVMDAIEEITINDIKEIAVKKHTKTIVKGMIICTNIYFRCDDNSVYRIEFNLADKCVVIKGSTLSVFDEDMVETDRRHLNKKALRLLLTIQ